MRIDAIVEQNAPSNDPFDHRQFHRSDTSRDPNRETSAAITAFLRGIIRLAARPLTRLTA
jgi:hypothetical protein